MRGNVFATVLVVFGLLVLLRNLGVIDIRLGELLHTWWPLIPIGIGIALYATPEPKIKTRAEQQRD